MKYCGEVTVEWILKMRYDSASFFYECGVDLIKTPYF